MDSFKKVFHDKYPETCESFSFLRDDCISKNNYLHAIDVWIMFKMETMGDYHDLYLKTEVLPLADAFEQFIIMCLEYYELDSCHYFRSPGMQC